MTKQFKQGFLLALISALGFSTLAIFTKLVYAEQVNIPTILTFRFLIASVAIWLYLFFLKVNWKVPKKHLSIMLLLGTLGYGSMSTSYFASLQYISASMAAMLLYMYPSFVTLLAFFWLKEPLTKRKIWALLFSLLGMGIVLWNPAGIKFNFLGIAFGLAAAVIYSVYIVLGGKYSRENDPRVFSAYIITGAAVSFSLYGLATGEVILRLSSFVWLAIGLMSLFSTVIAIVTFFAAVNKIGASKASIISTFEPLFTTLLAIIFLEESLSFWQGVGGVFILSSVILLQEKQGKEIHQDNESKVDKNV